MQTDMQPLRVAIIGGGISGLSSAYYLLKQAKAGGQRLQIDLYERKATLGGNADTVVVDLGNITGKIGPVSAYLRWADLGVNDVNLATYVRLKAIMGEIGYLDNMKPLQDTTSYFSHSGTLALTDDAALQNGVSNPAFSLANADGGLLAPLIQVVHQSALALWAGVPTSYTVGMFFDACIEKPWSMLHKAADKLGITINWDDAGLQQRVRQVRDAIYYPRIAAMYFTDERGPETLPLRAPFEYYSLQEGAGPAAAKPARCYFAHGAQKWLEALADYLLAQADSQVGIAILKENPVRLQVHAGSVSVLGTATPVADYGLCMLATHADDTLAMLHFDSEVADFGVQVSAILSQVSYTTGFGVCHTYTGPMPSNVNLWRTYNVLQRDPGDLCFPYRMSYVENLHQNDPVNPEYAGRGLPLFLISMVRSLDEIPLETMLDRVSSTARVSAAMLAQLPQATRRHLQGEKPDTGYRTSRTPVHPKYEGKAHTVFKHNVLNAECYSAQAQIQSFNDSVAAAFASGGQAPCPLLFGGGWTNGAGLQEQCIAQSELLAGSIAPALGASSPAPVPRRAGDAILA